LANPEQPLGLMLEDHPFEHALDDLPVFRV